MPRSCGVCYSAWYLLTESGCHMNILDAVLFTVEGGRWMSGSLSVLEQSGHRGSNRLLDTQTRFATRGTKATLNNGGPEEIPTPDPQIRSLILSNSLTFLDFP